MGYTKQWVPPVAPISENLANWKIIMQEIHDNLVTSGWEQTTAPGQIEDLNDVTALPAQDMRTHFRIYRLDDGHSFQHGEIYMRVTFTRYRAGMSQSWHLGLAPGCRIEVSQDSTFPAGMTFVAASPSGWVNGNTSSSYTATLGVSMICSNPELGFYGFVYGSGSIMSTSISPSAYEGCPFAILIQRHLTNDLLSVESGFSVYGMNTGGGASGSPWQVTKETFPMGLKTFSPTFVTENTIHNHSPRPFGQNVVGIPGGTIQVAPVYHATPEIKQCPTLVSYLYSQMGAGTQFELETVGGNILNMISLGETGLSAGHSSCIAMLYQ